MGRLTLVILVVYAALTLGVRAWIQRIRTGSFGVYGMRAGASASEWLVGVLLVSGTAASAAACIADFPGGWRGGVGPLRIAGVTIMLAGTVATFLAQLAMGSSWRVGVNREERTALVTGGPYAWVRNPIYTAMLLTAVGLMLAVPNPLSAAAFALILAGLEVQVRFVEEPWLVQRHGESYRDYTGAVGRFVPFVGRRRMS